MDDVQSVQDSVREAIAEIEKIENGESEEVEAVEEATDAPEASEEKAEEVAASEEAEATEELGDAAEAEDGAEEAESEEEPEEVTLAPASWSAKDREVWAKLDPEAQKIVARREGERDRITNTTAKEVAPLKAVIDEHAEYFRQINMTPEQSFRGLVAAERSLRFGTPQQKTEALEQIARQYGIAMPVAAGTGQEAEAFTDPDVAALRSEFGEQMGEIKTLLTSRQQADDAAQMAAADRFFDELESADASEFPEARYRYDVMPRFDELVAAECARGMMPDVAQLKELYRDAAWGTAGVRDRLVADARAREQAREKAARRTRRKVTSSASGGSGQAAHSEDEPPVDESVRDTIARTMRDMERSQGAIR